MYGVVVRFNGIVVDSPRPAGVTASDFSPRMVSVLIDTSDWSPSLILGSTVNVTFATSPASPTPFTWPTLIPDTLTSLPGEIPPASAKYASQVLPCGQNGSFW